jgi:hypothetical protein
MAPKDRILANVVSDDMGAGTRRVLMDCDAGTGSLKYASTGLQWRSLWPWGKERTIPITSPRERGMWRSIGACFTYCRYR